MWLFYIYDSYTSSNEKGNFHFSSFPQIFFVNTLIYQQYIYKTSNLFVLARLMQ